MSNPLAFIVEDNADLGFIYEEVLRTIQFDTERVTSGKDALERLKKIVPHLIVLDMNLPQVSGHYILKQIRADERLAHIPVIIATANVPLAQAMQPELGENDMVLIKPVSASELRELALRFR
jgi:two-component system cell cycle response regulator DivK